MYVCACAAFLCVPAVVFGQAADENPAPVKFRNTTAPTINDPVPVSNAQEMVPSATDKNSRRWPSDSYRTNPEVGISQRSLFRDTGAPYTNVLRPISVGATARQGSLDTGISVDLPDVRTRFPLLDRAFEPQDADLKIGPLFFKLKAISGAILWSDNVEHSEDDRESDAIAITRIAGTVYAQLTEGLQLSASGNFIYLPFEGKGGLAGFPLLAPYTFGLEGNTAAESQIAWDTMLGGWNVIFADDFRIGAGRFSTGTRDDFDLFEGGDFNDADRAGRYVFRGNGNGRGSPDSDLVDDTDIDPIYYANTVSAATERLVPGPARLRVRAYHTNLWYNQGNRGRPGLRGNDADRDPRTVDGLIAGLTSERDNLRFKPFLRYSAIHTNNFDGFDQEIRLGIDGPITDQLQLHADTGVHIRGETGDTRWLYGIGLVHQAGPYTTQSIHAERLVLELAEEVVDHVSYRFTQVLGPKLSFDAFASIGTIEDLDVDEEASDFVRLGARFTLYAGPRTVFRAGYIYSDISSTGGLRNDDDDRDPETSERKTHTIRLELTYRWTDELQTRLLYQYQERDANRPGDSYYENLLFLTLTKYFD